MSADDEVDVETAADADLGSELAGYLLERLRLRRRRVALRYRHPFVATEPDLLRQRDSAQEGYFERLGGIAAAAVTEDVGVVAALRTGVAAHVFDDTEDRDVQVAEHRQRLGRDAQRHVLRRGYHDNST